MNKMYSLLSGIAVGAGVVLPGVSGSVIAIMLGIYDKIIYLLNDKSKNIYCKFKILSPLLIGLIIGVVSFGNILLLLFEKYEIQMKYIFIGLILGGIPVLNKEIKNKENGRINYKFLIVSLLISLSLFVLPKFNMTFSTYGFYNIPFVNLLVAGFFYISGKIIPGVSSSFFMILFGLYDYILMILANPLSFSLEQYVKFIPFVLGIIVGFLILIKLINYLLSKHFVNAYSSIIGFVIGSVFAIFPGIKLEFNYIISIIFMIIAFLFTYYMGKK